ncbi:MAG: DUF4388 domain-containing protein [Deltaproteobacteria bacterium]|nr:DUF4388 domain-containing protein [Deltaproteobacteria bacterium]
MALKGTLRDFSAADIFQLIAQQQKNGVLVVSNANTVVRVFFSRGSLVRAELAEKDKERDILGQMLVRGEVCKENELAFAMDIRQKTLKRLEDILMEEGIVSKENLREFIKLRNMETISRLFGWKDGLYEFEQTDVTYDPSLETPVGAEAILMEAFRIVDEWPSVRQVITSYNMTFGVMGTGDQFEAMAREKEFGGSERKVFRLLLEDPGRDVQKIIDLARLGEFESCKTLFNLAQAGLLDPVQPRRQKKLGDMSGGSLAEEKRFKPVRAILVALLAVTFVVSTLLFGRIAYGTAVDFLRGRSEDSIKRWALGEALSTAQKKKIARVIEAWRLTRGSYPPSLETLADEGLLSKRDIRYPWELPYSYRPTGTGYVLLDPPY